MRQSPLHIIVALEHIHRVSILDLVGVDTFVSKRYFRLLVGLISA